jgi:hypothetical protein
MGASWCYTRVEICLMFRQMLKTAINTDMDPQSLPQSLGLPFQRCCHLFSTRHSIVILDLRDKSQSAALPFHHVNLRNTRCDPRTEADSRLHPDRYPERPRPASTSRFPHVKNG